MEHSSVAVSQLFKFFDVAALVEGATKRKCRVAIQHLQAAFGDVEAGSVTVPMIGQWQVQMKDKGLSVASIRSYFASASEVYSWGVENGVLGSNPFSAAKKIRAVKREVCVLTTEELTDFCRAAAEKDREDPTAKVRWFLMLEIASTSGLRSGEVQNLRWDDLDLETGVVHVRYRPDVYGQSWQWGAKGKSDREVPLSQSALDGLHRLRDMVSWRYPFLKRVTVNRLLASVGSIPESVRKQPYTNFYRELREIKALADLRRQAKGLPPIKNGGLHVFRKTAVTNWVRHGVTLPDAQYAAGHQSDQTTKEFYVAVLRSHAVESVRAAIS